MFGIVSWFKALWAQRQAGAGASRSPSVPVLLRGGPKFLDYLPDAVLVVDGTGSIRHVNSQFTAMFGYELEEIRGRSVETLIPERLRQRHADHRRDFSTSSRIRPMGMRFDMYGVRRNGREFPIDIMLGPLSSAQGDLVLAVVRDISDQKRAEREVREQKLQLDTALDNMAQGLIMIDYAARIIVCNERYLRMYGLSPEAARPGSSLRDLLKHRADKGSSGDVDRVYRDILARMNERTPSTHIAELPHGRVVRISIQPMAGGGLVSTHEDITERHRAESERDRAQQFLSQVLDNVPAVITVKGAADLKYLLANRSAEKYFGTSRTEMIGKTAHELLPKATADLVVAQDEEVLRAGCEKNFDAQVVETPGKGRRVINARRMPMRGTKGNVQFLLDLVDDITERKPTAEQIADLTRHDALAPLPDRSAFAE